jgi:cell division protein FtsL
MMTRLNFMLLAALIACALAVVTSQHRARKLVIAIQDGKSQAQKMEVEWGQLRLEQSTWSMPSRVEKIVSQQLMMAPPDAKQIQYVHDGGAQ